MKNHNILLIHDTRYTIQVCNFMKYLRLSFKTITILDGVPKALYILNKNLRV